MNPWSPTLAEYHADPATGSTMLGDLRENPGLYYGRYVTKTIPAKRVGKVAKLGSMLHHVLSIPENPGASEELAEIERLFPSEEQRGSMDAFGAEAVARRCVGDALHVVPVDARTAKKFKQAEADHGERACTRPESEVVVGTVASLMRAETSMAKLAKWLLIECPGQREYSHRWGHPSGETCKVRFDALPDPHEGLPETEHCFVDLKFVNEPTVSAFTNITARYRRHCQAALYSLGYFDLRGAWPVVCYVMIGNEPPHAIKTVTMSEAFIEIGLDQIQRDLNQLAECRRSGVWHDDEELEEAIIPELEPPYWLEREYNERLDS